MAEFYKTIVPNGVLTEASRNMEKQLEIFPGHWKI